MNGSDLEAPGLQPPSAGFQVLGRTSPLRHVLRLMDASQNIETG